MHRSSTEGRLLRIVCKHVGMALGSGDLLRWFRDNRWWWRRNKDVRWSCRMCLYQKLWMAKCHIGSISDGPPLSVSSLIRDDLKVAQGFIIVES